MIRGYPFVVPLTLDCRKLCVSNLMVCFYCRGINKSRKSKLLWCLVVTVASIVARCEDWWRNEYWYVGWTSFPRSSYQGDSPYAISGWSNPRPHVWHQGQPNKTALPLPIFQSSGSNHRIILQWNLGVYCRRFSASIRFHPVNVTCYLSLVTCEQTDSPKSALNTKEITNERKRNNVRRDRR